MYDTDQEIDLVETGKAIYDDGAPAELQYWLVDDFADILPQKGRHLVARSVEAAV